MSQIQLPSSSDTTVTFYLQDRDLKQPSVLGQNAITYKCSVSDIHVQNHHLFSRHSVILSQSDCDKLPETLKQEGWFDFFKANVLWTAEGEYPTDFPDSEKKGKKRQLVEAAKILIDLSDRLKFPPALNSLAICYYWGLGVPKDLGKMVSRFKQAADLNYAMSIRNLGWCHREGQGLPRNFQMALGYYERAAKLGLVIAYMNIADLYENATPPNMQEALRFYQIGADKGDEESKKRLEELRKASPAIVPQAAQPRQTQGQSTPMFQDFFQLLPRVQALQGQVQQLTQQLIQKDRQIAEMQKQQDVHNAEMKATLALILQKLDSKESAGD